METEGKKRQYDELGTDKNNGQEGEGVGKKKSNVACNNCRKAHIKCLKQDQELLNLNLPLNMNLGLNLKCRYCLMRNLECNYSDKNQKIMISLSYLNELQDKIKVMEEQLQSKSVGTEKIKTEQDGAQQQQEEEEEDETFECNYQIRSGRLVKSQNGLNNYFIGSSSMTLFNLEIQSLISKFIYNEDSTNSKLEENSIHISSTNKRIEIDIDEVSLPNYDYASKLLKTFIDFNCGCFYFFNEGIFHKQLRDFYKLVKNYKSLLNKDKKPFYYNGVWLIKMLLIFGIGEMYLLGNSKEIKNFQKYKFFDQSNSFFNKIFDLNNMDTILTLNVDGIETMFLYCFYLQVIDSTINSYLCLGQTVRACLLLGWHVDSQTNNLNSFEIEHKRRLWWTIYIFERMFSSKAGLPLNLSDSNISTELPNDMYKKVAKDIDLKNNSNSFYTFSKAETLGNCVKIVQINGKILSKLYQKQPTTNILPILKGILKDLLEWRTNLPSNLQFDFHIHDSNFKISRQMTNLYTEYFHGINVTLRPILFHFITLRLKDEQYSELNVKSRSNNILHGTYINLQNYSTTILSLLNSALRASINTIRSLWSLYQQKMVALFGFMDREYLFSAAFTLNLFNATFGVNEQTMIHIEHSLIILQKMVTLGSEPAILRKTQLLSLMAKLDFHGIVTDLINKYNDDELYGNIPLDDIQESVNFDAASKKQSSIIQPNSLPNIDPEENLKLNKELSSSFLNLSSLTSDVDKSNGIEEQDTNNNNGKDNNLFYSNGMNHSFADKLARINSFSMIPFTDIVNESLAQGKQTDLTKSETEIMTENVHQLNPPCTYNNTDLQFLLDSLDRIGYDDTKMWNEISHQANWLGDTMDPAAAPGSELYFGNIDQINK